MRLVLALRLLILRRWEQMKRFCHRGVPVMECLLLICLLVNQMLIPKVCGLLLENLRASQHFDVKEVKEQIATLKASPANKRKRSQSPCSIRHFAIWSPFIHLKVLMTPIRW